MNTVDLDSLSRYARVLGTLRKNPGEVKALPPASFRAEQVTIDKAHLGRYSKICGFRSDQGVPLTYPQVLTFPLALDYMASEASPWSGIGTVHLANEITQHAALQAGNVVTIEMRTGELQAHRRGQVFTLVSKVLRDGEVIWTSTQSLLRLNVPNPKGKPYESLSAFSEPLARQSTFRAAGNIGRRYGLVSGDLNPIHLTTVSAKLFGFKRAIAHGMWTKARALASLLPEAPINSARVTVEFKSPLFLPTTAALWLTRDTSDTRFEVRGDGSQVTHLRGSLSLGH